jgi:phosphatidylglycerophosphate synthase
MLDSTVRPVIDPPLNWAARRLVYFKVPANGVTWTGFVIGLAVIPALAVQAYGLALALIALHSLADGLDGAIARASHTTDYGGFLDIVLDFIFYAGVVLGMALAQPEHAVYAAFLIWTFMGTASSFLAYAVLAEKHGLTTDIRGDKSLYYLGGLAEGTETLITLVLFCLVPQWFPVIAAVFGIMCILTAVGRVMAAKRAFWKP